MPPVFIAIVASFLALAVLKTQNQKEATLAAGPVSPFEYILSGTATADPSRPQTPRGSMATGLPSLADILGGSWGNFSPGAGFGPSISGYGNPFSLSAATPASARASVGTATYGGAPSFQASPIPSPNPNPYWNFLPQAPASTPIFPEQSFAPLPQASGGTVFGTP